MVARKTNTLIITALITAAGALGAASITSIFQSSSVVINNPRPDTIITVAEKTETPKENGHLATVTCEDGFLALRSEPKSMTGKRLAMIPTGTVIKLYDCQTTERKDIDLVAGHWCRCNYNGLSGWVFETYTTPVHNNYTIKNSVRQ